MIRKIVNWCMLFLVVVGGLSIWYYLDSEEYLVGELKHYIGTSVVSQGEFVLLAENKSLPMYSVTEITLLENGLVEVTYDFFSTDGYSFLVVAPFSYFDTPIVNTLYEVRYGLYFLAGGAIIILIISKLLNSYYAKEKDAGHKLANAAWCILHPQFLFSHQQTSQVYSSQNPTTLEINPKGVGIYATRTWKYRKGYLYSSGVGQARWDTRVLLANKFPMENNENGVYALRLGVTHSDWEFMKHILGIVSLSGEWLEHADGVLRAESCEIISLIVSHYYKAVALELSSTYGVPVIVADNPINTYLNWLYSENGVECLRHNADILKG